MKKLANIIILIGFASAFLLLLVLGHWSMYPYKILDIKGVYKVITPVVKVGGELRFERNVNKLMQIQGEVNCSIVDGIEYKLPSRKSITMKGMDKSVQSLIIPSQIVPGEYKYVCHLTFQPNPIRTVVYYMETEKFTVTK